MLILQKLMMKTNSITRPNLKYENLINSVDMMKTFQVLIIIAKLLDF